MTDDICPRCHDEKYNDVKYANEQLEKCLLQMQNANIDLVKQIKTLECKLNIALEVIEAIK